MGHSGFNVKQCVLMGQLKASDVVWNVRQRVLMKRLEGVKKKTTTATLDNKQDMFIRQLKETMYAKCETMRVNGTAEEVRRRKQR